MNSKTVVFIHGMYMNSLCWEGWEERFQAKGFKTHAPNWPGRDKSIAELRNESQSKELGKLTLTQIVNHYTNFIKDLDEKPVIVGHSMGGLTVQLLLQNRLASSAIAIDSAPPAGVFTPKFSFIKANWGHITPFANQSLPVVMTFERFQYAFVNDMPLDEQKAAFERYVVPESRAVPRESLTTKVDFKNKKNPLLLIAGGNDNIIPASLNETNYKRYKSSSSVTDFKEFSGRNHFILGQNGWEEVADYCIEWIEKQS